MSIFEYRDIRVPGGGGGYLLPPGADPWPDVNDADWLRLLDITDPTERAAELSRIRAANQSV